MSDFTFYFKLGWQHILTWQALDHIFFIAALSAIYLLKDWRQVLILITAFTLGHTVTLVLSTLRIIEASAKWIEFLIPCTIMITAASNLFIKSFDRQVIQVNYVFAFFFGLIHGLAFANTLRMILADDQGFAVSMFSFSIGLEVAQAIIVLGILVLSQLLINTFKLKRKHWVMIISTSIFGFALVMAVQRWPGHKKQITFIEKQTKI